MAAVTPELLHIYHGHSPPSAVPHALSNRVSCAVQKAFTLHKHVMSRVSPLEKSPLLNRCVLLLSIVVCWLPAKKWCMNAVGCAVVVKARSGHSPSCYCLDHGSQECKGPEELEMDHV